MKNLVTISEKQATGKGDIAGTKLTCSCGWSMTTSMASDVNSLAYEHNQWHAAKSRVRG